MADLRNWTKIEYLHKTFYESYMHLVAKIEGASGFKVECIFVM